MNADRSSVHVRLLGPLAISRDGVVAALPASRKVRALVGYLSLAPRAASRSQLCDLLWNDPRDPRAALRWCVSKLRRLIDEPGRRRVASYADTLGLDLADCFVDAIDVIRAIQAGVTTLPREELQRLLALFKGEFLDGLEIEGHPAFHSWLTGQRRRFRGCRAALLEQLVTTAAGDELLGHLQEWLELTPFDRRVHELLLGALAQSGRIREAEEHLAATARLFEAEGLDHTLVRDLWRAAKLQADGPRNVTAEDCFTRQHPPASCAEDFAIARRRASVAVMPFIDRTIAMPAAGGPAAALADDVITRLAKLRSLFVIAQATIFALSERGMGPQEAGRILNVDYVAGGALQRRGNRLELTVELVETRTARIVWAEVFNRSAEDTFLVLEEVGNNIVASIASEIERIERNNAVLKPPDSLDAWEAHHRGLWHMYRFNRADNERARHFFETAVRLDPTFARAHAGLSFTHFQNAFQGWAKREPEVERALDAAGASLMADDRDPAAHLTMGRALWLLGRFDESILELEQAVELSPNFALAHYAMAFVHSHSGDPRTAVARSDHSRHLSPFDPLLFAMLGTRALALARLHQFEEAADWGVKAAARPNAHVHVRAIATYCLALAGRLPEARAHMAAIHRTLPGYGIREFLSTMQFEPDAAALFRGAARCLTD